MLSILADSFMNPLRSDFPSLFLQKLLLTITYGTTTLYLMICHELQLKKNMVSNYYTE